MRLDPPNCNCTDCITGYSMPSMLYEWVRATERFDLAELLAEVDRINGPVSPKEIEAALAEWPDSAYPQRQCCDTRVQQYHRPECERRGGAQ